MVARPSSALLALFLVAGSACAQPTQLAPFDGPEMPVGWRISGPVSLDMNRNHGEGRGGSLRVDPNGHAFLPLADLDTSAQIDFWVYEEAKAPADPKKHAAGPLWGLAQRATPRFAVGPLYAPYLSGQASYATADYDPAAGQSPWQEVQYLGIKRTEGWHRWTFDMNSDSGLRILHNGQDVNARHKRFNWHRTRLLGVNGLLFEGDASGAGQTLWVDDISITRGPPMNATPVWPPPPPKDFSVVPPPQAQTDQPYQRWSRGPEKLQGRFPIAVWLQDPKNAARYREAGFNLFIGLWKGPTEEQLAALRAAGMSVICDQNEVGLKHIDDPTIVGWMHGDEPDNAHRFKDYWGSDVERIKQAWPEIEAFRNLGPDKPYRGYGPAIPPKWIVRDYQQIAARDPSRPVFINLGQGVAWEAYHGRGERSGKLEDYAEYVKGADIVSFDIYPAVHSDAAVHGSLWYVPRGVGRLRAWSNDAKIVWNCIECTRISNVNTKPTPAQVRAEVWMSIIHGSRGLIYFVHQFKPTFIEAGLFADPEMLAAVTALNHQVQALAPVICSPTIADGATAESSNPLVPVHQIVKRHEGTTYLFAASMYSRDTTATFALAGLPPAIATAEVLGEGRTLPVKDGRFSDPFPGYTARVYRLR